MFEKNIKSKKSLLDLLLSYKDMSSKKQAEAYILSGNVLVNGILTDKPGTLINIDSKIEIKEKIPYVSRGAIKLDKAVRDFKIKLQGRDAIDFGASTGGFSDYLIKNGVKRVISVDVGYGQFAWELRNKENVFLFERTNIKKLEREMLPFIPDFAVADLSFISIRRIFNKIFELTGENATILLLIKPQFELEREFVENKGIIKNKNLHIKVLEDIVNFFTENNFINISGLNFSGIKGTKGNIEYWILLDKINKDFKAKKDINYGKIIEGVVDRSHDFFANNIV